MQGQIVDQDLQNSFSSVNEDLSPLWFLFPAILLPSSPYFVFFLSDGHNSHTGIFIPKELSKNEDAS